MRLRCGLCSLACEFSPKINLKCLSQPHTHKELRLIELQNKRDKPQTVWCVILRQSRPEINKSKPINIVGSD